MKKKVLAKDTLVTTSKIVLPNDTNTLGNLFGGELLAWMDNCAAIAAGRFCGRVVVTASVGNVTFNHPIKLADVVTLEAKVSRAFSSSMEIFIDVFTDVAGKDARKLCATGIYNFVAVDQYGSTIEVPKLIPESEREVERYNAALRRKQLSLILGGKMKPEEATELKALFAPDGTEKMV